MKSCNNKDINVKVLITYKEKHKLFKSDILMPIQTGRAIADEIFEDMIGISNLYLILLPIISSFLIGGWIGTPSLWGCAGFLYKKY